jgi:hypothetical protein
MASIQYRPGGQYWLLRILARRRTLMVWTPPTTASMCQGGGVEQPPELASRG